MEVYLPLAKYNKKLPNETVLVTIPGSHLAAGTSGLAQAILNAPELKKTKPSFVPPQNDMRSDLLKAIRDGELSRIFNFFLCFHYQSYCTKK